MIYVTFQYKPSKGNRKRYAVECEDIAQCDKVADSMIGKEGFYYVRISAGGYSLTKRMILTREEFYKRLKTLDF